MSIQHKLRKVLLCLVLEGGLLMGVPMRPREIAELLHSMNRPRVEVTVRDEKDKTD